MKYEAKDAEAQAKHAWLAIKTVASVPPGKPPWVIPPHFSPVRGPPLWDECSDAQTDEGVHIEPDQRINW
jgi:hypothetical protein